MSLRSLHRSTWSALVFALLSAGAFILTNSMQSADSTPARLDLKPGDRISIIGNTLADRMQHDGHLETELQRRFPKHHLSVRNLGFSGDELTLRLRSSGFGSPDTWLGMHKTDVVFAFFGYNESFAGKAGLPKFKTDLASFIQHTLKQTYNGKTAPRLVLFSPIAHENLHDVNLPDGSENNKRLPLYTAAMREVAGANKVPFVDLFTATRTLYGKTKTPLTINGIHLTPEGDRLLAGIIGNSLFGQSPEAGIESNHLAKLRKAIEDKNFFWFERYRTTDGFSIYGGRADLRFVEGQTNRVVAQREMEVLDVMTANRDRHIWAIARGDDLPVNDSNTPPFIPVVTNKPGSLPGGKHVYLDPEKAIERMTIAPGMKVNLFASEKQFPELVNPVQMSWDTKGRLWVAVWPTYPHWKPKESMNDKILILEDTDGDGKADKCTVFADGLHCPTGFEFSNGGILVAQAPDLLFLKDTKGTGKADLRKRVLHGLDSADTHHTSNSFTLDPGGALYFQEGTFHHTQVETPYGPSVRCANAGVFRYEPRTQKFDVYVSYGFANPHGHVFDRWGQDIVIDGTGANPYHAALFSGHLNYPDKHASPPQVWSPRSRPCPAMEVMSSRHFPAEMQGDMLVPNVIGFQGIFRYKLSDDGASFTGVVDKPILSSTDPNFRPSDIKIGPDGAIYFLDWNNPIIGHMQHNLRDPSRGREHGRVYRVTYPERKLLTSPKIADEPIAKLLDRLKEPEDRVRYRARIELAARPTADVLAAAKKWIAALDTKDTQYEHNLLEGLWLHQSHNTANEDLLKTLLSTKDFRARAAATRVLCYWRDKIPEALDLLRKQAADVHPRVRLEAVRAASFFTEAEAVEIVLVSEDKPADKYIEFVRRETMRTLQPYVRKAIADGRKIAFKTRAGARYFLKTVSTDDLMKMERTPSVFIELMFRPNVRDEFRSEALKGLARLEKKPEMRVLLDAITNNDQTAESDDSVAFDLVRLLSGRPVAELAGVRADLEKLATKARQPINRQLGFVALVAADAKTDMAWTLATRTVRSLADFVNAVPMLSDPGLRSSLYPKVSALLTGLPKELASPATNRKSVKGRYVRIELPGSQRTLTLAEVEVFSDDVNVARKGKAKQINTGYGGEARRAIDGNKSGTFSDGGQTHTREGTDNAWWEVDLGSEVNIESIVVWNRTDGNLGSRLKNFRLVVLDKDRNVAYQKKDNPAPAVKAEFILAVTSPEQVIRRAAMKALPSMRGQEAEAVKALAPFVKEDSDRQPAIQALQRIPARLWPKDQARPVLDGILAYVRKVPVKDRTEPMVVDALQLADAITTLLPTPEARKTRKELGELGVRVLRIGTLLERMQYDRERIVVQAGKPLEILFENTDTMPHNLVFIQPGSLEEIGNLAEITASQPKAMDRQYVPPSTKVWEASKLIQPRQAQRLKFNVPTKPGVYPFVCTYPGHWRRMHGAMFVVADLEEYQASPEKYLTQHPLKVADKLLEFNRPRTDWKLADLEPSVKTLTGRSHANGKQMFQVAACVSCHKLAGMGQDFGSDLTKLDPKWSPAEVLKHILDPSLKIDDKYRVYTFQMDSGKVHTGMILEETPKVVKLIENPLLPAAKPLIVKKANIEKRVASPSSLMPKGLLDPLTRDEVLDLLAFVVSGGDAKNQVYQGGHDHGGHTHGK